MNCTRTVRALKLEATNPRIWQLCHDVEGLWRGNCSFGRRGPGASRNHSQYGTTRLILEVRLPFVDALSAVCRG
jgi:hypothetical protein